MLTIHFRYRNRGYGRSRWTGWGRWVLLGVLVAVVLVIVLSCVCFRKRRGRFPRFRKPKNKNSTHMAYQAPTNYNHQNYAPTPYNENQGYNGGYTAPSGPPPQYGAGGTGMSGGFGGHGQREVVEMPGSVYQPSNGKV